VLLGPGLSNRDSSTWPGLELLRMVDRGGQYELLLVLHSPFRHRYQQQWPIITIALRYRELPIRNPIKDVVFADSAQIKRISPEVNLYDSNKVIGARIPNVSLSIVISIHLDPRWGRDSPRARSGLAACSSAPSPYFPSVTPGHCGGTA
jgi:hypothetical protein